MKMQSADPAHLFDEFLAADTLRAITNAFKALVTTLHCDEPSTSGIALYAQLKRQLSSWKAQKLWALLDKRASHKEYRSQRACPNTRVLVIGAGPCGLRMAIECALLGCKVVVLEKRDRFSRYNVLHIWPFVIQDLKNLGAKLMYPKFCAGSIDHISIRRLQCILLKIALSLGVELYEGVAFEELLTPTCLESGGILGWRAKVSPGQHIVSDYEFDVLVGADGKRNTVPGFTRREFRGKLAIGITANFINRRSQAEESVPEISGVAFVFNQQFFNDLKSSTGIDLENIVYYKDETHYFVMCIKKQSLLDRKVIRSDTDDVTQLLSEDNLEMEALLSCARDAADFATGGELPHLDFALNHCGLPDVAMFDFTSLYSSDMSARMVQRNGCRLVQCIVGDSLHEPFWPTGSGCARGFLSCLDAAWLIRSLQTEKHPLQCLAEREWVYRLLAQTTSENLHKNHARYTVDPQTRYRNLDYPPSIVPESALHLYDSDTGIITTVSSVNANRRVVYDKEEGLVKWFSNLTCFPYRLRVNNLTTSFRSGLVLAAVLHRYRPDLLDYWSLDIKLYSENVKKCFHLLQTHYSLTVPEIPPDELFCSTPSDQARAAAYDVLYKIRELFMNYNSEVTSNTTDTTTTIPAPPEPIAPSLLPAKRKVVLHLDGEEMTAPVTTHPRTPKQPSPSPRLPSTRQLSPLPTPIESSAKVTCQREHIRSEIAKLRERDESTAFNDRRSHVNDLLLGVGGSTNRNRPAQVERLQSGRLAAIEALLRQEEDALVQQRMTVAANQKPPSGPSIKARKFDSDEIEKMEWRLQAGGMSVLLGANEKAVKVLSSKEAKMVASKTASLRAAAEQGFQQSSKYDELDCTIKQLNRVVNDPARGGGAMKVATLAQQHDMSIKAKHKEPPAVPERRAPLKAQVIMPAESGNPTCYFCDGRVFLAERMCLEGHYLHRGCFRCAFCQCALRLEKYVYDRDVPIAYPGGRFYCVQHRAVSLLDKVGRLERRREKMKVDGDVRQKNAAPPIPDRPTPTHTTSHATPLSMSRSTSAMSDRSVKSTTTPERAEFLPNRRLVPFPASPPSIDDDSSEEDEIEEELIDLHNMTYASPSARKHELKAQEHEPDLDLTVTTSAANTATATTLQEQLSEYGDETECLDIEEGYSSSELSDAEHEYIEELLRSNPVQSALEVAQDVVNRRMASSRRSQEDLLEESRDAVAVEAGREDGQVECELLVEAAEEYLEGARIKRTNSLEMQKVDEIPFADEMGDLSFMENELEKHDAPSDLPPPRKPKRSRDKRPKTLIGSQVDTEILRHAMAKVDLKKEEKSPEKTAPISEPAESFEQQLEQIRAQARQRARLKSDAELGIPPASPTVTRRRIGTSRVAMPQTGMGLLAKVFGSTASPGSGDAKPSPSAKAKPNQVSPSQESTIQSESSKESSLLQKKKWRKRSEEEPKKQNSFILAPKATVDDEDLELGQGSSTSSTPRDTSESLRTVLRVQRVVEKLERAQQQRLSLRAIELQRTFAELDQQRSDVQFRGRAIELALRQSPTSEELLYQWLATIQDLDRLNRRQADAEIEAGELELDMQHLLLKERMQKGSKDSSGSGDEVRDLIDKRRAFAEDAQRRRQACLNTARSSKYYEILQNRGADYQHFDGVFAV